MKKVRAHYKGKYYYLDRAKNLEEELNLKRDFLRQIVNIPEEDIELFRIISRDAAEYAAKTFKPLYMKHIFGID